jgi:hypothetical protein
VASACVGQVLWLTLLVPAEKREPPPDRLTADAVADYGMDPGKLVLKWKQPTGSDRRGLDRQSEEGRRVSVVWFAMFVVTVIGLFHLPLRASRRRGSLGPVVG